MKSRVVGSNLKKKCDRCADCPLEGVAELAQKAARSISACQAFLEGQGEELTVAILGLFPDAPVHETAESMGEESKKANRSRGSHSASVLDRVVIRNDKKGRPRIRAVVAFDKLPMSLKLLLSILAADGKGTHDGLVPWKKKTDIIRNLAAADGKVRTGPALGELIYRLRKEFSMRGLDPDLVKTSRGRARLAVRSCPPTKVKHAGKSDVMVAKAM